MKMENLENKQNSLVNKIEGKDPETILNIVKKELDDLEKQLVANKIDEAEKNFDSLVDTFPRIADTIKDSGKVKEIIKKILSLWEKGKQVPGKILNAMKKFGENVKNINDQETVKIVVKEAAATIGANVVPNVVAGGFMAGVANSLGSIANKLDEETVNNFVNKVADDKSDDYPWVEIVNNLEKNPGLVDKVNSVAVNNLAKKAINSKEMKLGLIKAFKNEELVKKMSSEEFDLIIDGEVDNVNSLGYIAEAINNIVGKMENWNVINSLFVDKFPKKLDVIKKKNLLKKLDGKTINKLNKVQPKSLEVFLGKIIDEWNPEILDAIKNDNKDLLKFIKENKSLVSLYKKKVEANDPDNLLDAWK